MLSHKKSLKTIGKKGIFFSAVLDAYGWIIFILGTVVFILIGMWLNGYAVSKIEKASFKLDDNSALFSILRTDVGNSQNVKDLIAAAYLTTDKDTQLALQSNISSILNKVYGQAKEVCWKLYYYDNRPNIILNADIPIDISGKTLLSETDCDEITKTIFDGETIIPLPKTKEGITEIKIQLTVPGYKNS